MKQDFEDDALGMGTHPVSGQPIRIGVMGAASGEYPPAILEQCRLLGAAIARRGCCILTGACPGLPQAAVIGAKGISRGHAIGISPAMSFREHVEVFDAPWREFDVLIYTGLGIMGRELINIRSSDIVIVVGGGSGTLGEYAIAYDEGKLIGVLTGTGGVADVLGQINGELHKNTGAEVFYRSDPESLVTLLLKRFHADSYSCPCDPKKGGKVVRGDKETDACCISPVIEK